MDTRRKVMEVSGYTSQTELTEQAFDRGLRYVFACEDIMDWLSVFG